MTLRKDPSVTGRLYAPVPYTTSNEEWRDVVGWEESYMVSSLGRVYSLLRGLYLRPRPTKKGYVKVALKTGSSVREWHVHTMVAFTFIGPIPEGEEPNHKNGIKTDNRYDNLEYITHPKNVEHAWRTGLRKNRVSVSKLTSIQVAEIRELWNKSSREDRKVKGKLSTRLSNIFGVVPEYIWAVGTGRARANSA